jgi:Flp pilus assembly protein TadG
VTIKPARRFSDRGQGLVEFALVLPIFMLVLLLIVDFAWALRQYVQITNAAREGARYGVTCKYSDHTSPDGIKQRVAEYSSGLIAVADVTVPTNPCSSGSYPASPPTDPKVVVEVDYEYDWITPIGPVLNFVTGGTVPAHLPMHTSTTMRLE